MQASKTQSRRGRPPSETEGAQEAIAAVEAYLEKEGISLNQLALSLGMSPSSASRAMRPKGSPRWTPSLTRIYRVAESPDPTDRRAQSELPAVRSLHTLLATPTPAGDAVRAIIEDVQRLVDALAPSDGGER